MEGKELNAIYNGYSFQPLLLGHSYATSFQHYLDFEPHAKNHMVPHYGIFSKIYFGRMLKSCQGQDEKYSSFKKTHGPPYYQFNQRFGELEHDAFLQRRGVPVASLRQFEPKAQITHGPHH